LQILYKHKLNSNLFNLIKKEVEIKTVYDIGSHRGDFSNFLSKTTPHYLDNKIWVWVWVCARWKLPKRKIGHG
jgi:hypothetical protein